MIIPGNKLMCLEWDRGGHQTVYLFLLKFLH